MPYLIADYLIDRLVEHGVERLFGVPAVFCAAVFDAAGRKANFHTVVTNSDLEAGYAADGYGRAHGLSAVAVSYGPGNLSIVNAIAGAYLERSPVVVISGGRPRRTSTTRTRRACCIRIPWGSRTPTSTSFATSPRSANARRTRASFRSSSTMRSRPRWPPNTRCTWRP